MSSNSVQSLQFALADDSSVRAEALRQATAIARQKTEAMASALGLIVERVLFAEVGGGQIRPAIGRTYEARVADGAHTQVEPGTIEIRAVVTLTVAVRP